MRTQTGITLVEVLFLLVLLGIVAAALAPRYVDYTSDGRASSVRSMESTLLAAADLAYARAAFDGVERREAGQVELSSGMLPVRYGYPNFLAAESAEQAEQIMHRELNVTTGQWDYSYSESTRAIRLSPVGVNADITPATLDSINACFVEYQPPDNPGDRPGFNVNTEHC